MRTNRYSISQTTGGAVNLIGYRRLLTELVKDTTQEDRKPSLISKLAKCTTQAFKALIRRKKPQEGDRPTGAKIRYTFSDN
jgi:hypothetical protein